MLAFAELQVSALPPEYQSEFDTLEGSFEFANDKASIRRQDCWRRPILFLFFEPGSTASLKALKTFQTFKTKHEGSGLCAIAVSTRIASQSEAEQISEAAPGVSVFLENLTGSRLVTRLFIGEAPRLPEVALVDRLGRIGYHNRGAEIDWEQLSGRIDAEAKSLGAELGHPWVVPKSTETPENRERSDFMSEVANAMGLGNFKVAGSLALEALGPKPRYRLSDWSRLYDFFTAAQAQFAGETSADVERRARSFVKARPRDTSPRVLLAQVLAMRGSETKGDARLGFYREAAAILDDKTIDMESNPHSFVVRISIMENMFWKFEEIAAMVERGCRRHPNTLDIQTEFVKYVSYLDTEPGHGWARAASELNQIPSYLSANEAFAYIVVPVCFNNFWMAPNCVAKSDELAPHWVRLRDGHLEILRKWPKMHVFRNSLAWFACLLNDRRTARRQFEIIGEDFEPAVWGNEVAYRFWRRWASKGHIPRQVD